MNQLISLFTSLTNAQNLTLILLTISFVSILELGIILLILKFNLWNNQNILNYLLIFVFQLHLLRVYLLKSVLTYYQNSGAIASGSSGLLKAAI
ncbi:hypothetical protein CONCODRAFT_141571 [Conidiobolus coronatus NRRL 28638]|uniref:Uncharacterized protein n=1 Tax=Conidiobolus coronatus (strain ATCC 28846 / CBS 209.66 / NRRL 28638) TaxID=796925 RepID=A0A137NRX6_CONC2|nr:hypothetical protein CONCODRAFT_141571 [Conidiobolus coronatus NRRL 28638]|eukprot:KXN65498.1 hypothetical protein CONCODRAFT_141571 [Conidiobolus coronatus NRRL 28638]